MSILQSRDIENVPKRISFSILGFFWLGVKLGFDFPGVIPNQKSQPRSLKFYFYEERNSMPFQEHLEKFHLDLCISRDRNSPQVSCLGRNPWRGWNPNLEESYLLEYREYEAENWTQCALGIYIRPVKV